MLENYQALLGIRKIICWVSEMIKPSKTIKKTQPKTQKQEPS